MSSITRANIEEYSAGLIDADKSAFKRTKELIKALEAIATEKREELDKAFQLTLEQRKNEVTEQA